MFLSQGRKGRGSLFRHRPVLADIGGQPRGVRYRGRPMREDDPMTEVRADPSRRVLLRAMARIALAVSAGLALAGCTALSSAGSRYDVAEISGNPTLLVATTRKPVDGARTRPWFGTERASTMSIARAKLVAPDEGRFSLSSVGLGDWSLEGVYPVRRLDDLIAPTPEQRDVLLYVHGFNQTFETAALDAARLSEGIRFRGDTMLFSWPSKAKLFDYGYDRESAMWSRDALERVLSLLVANPSVGRIHVVAHSVGTMLSMEALRQIYARHGMAVTEKIGAVIFASPDIDMDVFTSSVERIPPLAPKITVITATNDRALAVAGWLAGGMTRVGAAEKAQLEQLGLRVIDASGEGFGIINHDLFLSNSHIRLVIRRAVAGSQPDHT
jgi:esterase/lipase superfamily enzyme